ncbi:MAG TPA: NUDIX hydrolase, partial [Candidatus Saccharimonadales bacterium]
MAKAPPKLPNTYYRVSVKALVFDDQQRLLVLNGEGGWEIPGGGMEHDEDYAACMQRELQEEIGVAVTAVGDEEFTYRCSTQAGQPKIAIAATAKLASYDFKLEKGITEARFVTLEEFMQLTFQKSEDGVQSYVNRIWKRRPESAMDSPMYRVTARALIFDERMRLLVVEDNDGRYELPGGGWEHNESLEQCIAREIKEELGVSALWVGKLWFCYR